MSAPELLNCPFCGSPAVISTGWAVYKNDRRDCKVQCSERSGKCLINARTHYLPTVQEAVEQWNTRADLCTPSPTDERVTRLVGALRKFEAHYPMGINPMLDEAAIAARAALRDMGVET